jgi:hypothetical protein
MSRPIALGTVNMGELHDQAYIESFIREHADRIGYDLSAFDFVVNQETGEVTARMKDNLRHGSHRELKVRYV